MDESFVGKMEAVQQELHSAKQQISILNATVAHLSAENSDLQHELSEVLETGKEYKVRIKSTSDMYQYSEDKVSDLTERLQLALQGKEEVEKKLQELSSLQEENQSDVSKSSHVVCNCEAEIGTLQLHITHLESEMEMKKNSLSQAVQDLRVAMETNVNLKAEMDELESELECLQSQITSQSNVIQGQREELDGLRSQAESSDICVDTNRKGNSLFSEVEDRRVMAETKMVKTLDKFKNMESRLEKERKENQRLKSQVSLLMRSSNKHSDKTVRALEQEVEDSKQQILKLTQVLAQKPTQQPLKTAPPVEYVTSSQPLSKSEVNMITFLKATVANLQKEREEALKEKNQLHIQNVQLDFLWTQKKNQVRALTTEKERMSALTAHQALVIDSLKAETDFGDMDHPKEMVKITEMDNTQPKVKLEALNSPESSDLGLIQQCTSTENSNGSHNKENNALSSCNDIKSYILGTKTKSVAFSDQCDDDDDGVAGEGVLGSLDNHRQQEKDKTSGVGGKAGVGKCKRQAGSRGNGGKYRSVSYATLEESQPDDEQTPECNQQ